MKGFSSEHASMFYSRYNFFQTLSFISIVVSITRAQTCWYPDGKTQALNDTTCHHSTNHSTCCGQQANGSPAYCLSNGLCLIDLVVTRGSCTDASWQSPYCSTYCQGNFSGSKVPQYLPANIMIREIQFYKCHDTLWKQYLVMQ